ncbi:SIR2 family protein [Dermacoccus abyssi]|uniref:SIR2 family protein n=1 Tax=Dermacoccus abyssi TaxID=322596 RepID=A0ABX5ZBH3_9MICO|nr:SIR2 family protein [Dermacoccus abyssi]
MTQRAVPGHVFVVHGRLQDVTCDAIVIPTDTSFTVEPHWDDVMGVQGHAKPAGWVEKHFGPALAQVKGERQLFWYLDVTDDDRVIDLDRLGERFAQLTAEIVAGFVGKEPVRKRAQHLIALPLLSAGKGGHAPEGAIARLLPTFTQLAAEHHVDFAVVVLDRERFEALQRRRLETLGFDVDRSAVGSGRTRAASPTAPEGKVVDQGEAAPAAEARQVPDWMGPDGQAARLGRRATQRGLSLMIGAGVSAGAGLPTWDTLLEGLKAHVSAVDEPLVKDRTYLSALDQAELLERLITPDNAGPNDATFGNAVISTLGLDGKTKVRPALGHLLLAGLQCPQAATTNYDRLYEAAFKGQHTLTPATAGPRRAATLPYERPEAGQSWILKMHGDAEHPESLVLSRSSFVSYDSARRPAGSLFQGMLMTSHVLFVGVSFTDDNVLRLTHEVADYLGTSASDSDFGTVLTLGEDAQRARLWKDHLTWHALEAPESVVAAIKEGVEKSAASTAADKPSAEAGETTKSEAEKRASEWKLLLPWRARALEIFLDIVAMWAVAAAE